MLEYALDDADFLLEKNLNAAVKTLAQVEEDLGFLRDQMTTLEVSILAITLLVPDDIFMLHSNFIIKLIEYEIYLHLGSLQMCLLDVSLFIFGHFSVKRAILQQKFPS